MLQTDPRQQQHYTGTTNAQLLDRLDSDDPTATIASMQLPHMNQILNL